MSSGSGWNDSEKALWFQVDTYDGQSLCDVQPFEFEIQESFDLSKAVLRKRFKPDSKREYYKLEFEY